jgi:hypothetical protein
MSERLEPCPFCGGEATLRDGSAECRKCHAGIDENSEEAAIAAWNRRERNVVWCCGDCGYRGGVLIVQAMCPECDSIHVRPEEQREQAP